MRLEDIYYQDKCVVLFDAPATSSRGAHWKRESSEASSAVAFAFFQFCKMDPEKGFTTVRRTLNEHAKKLISVPLSPLEWLDLTLARHAYHNPLPLPGLRTCYVETT